MNVGLCLCYARSGGTLINQMIGCLPDVIVLSEVSPYGGGWGRQAAKSFTTPAEQLAQWYGLEIPSGSFEFELVHAIEVCDKLGKRLVIRDWPFIAFTPAPQNKFNPPGRLVTLDILNKLGVSVDAFALVRHPISIWMSRGEPSNEADYLIPYMKYTESLASLDIPLFRYEDLCKNPDKVMKRIANVMKLQGIGTEWRAFNTFKHVNGDVQNPHSIERHFGKGATIALSQSKPKNYEEFVKIYFRQEFQQATCLTGYALPSKLSLLGMLAKALLIRSKRIFFSRGKQNE
jgi:hypothetical protein